MTNFIEELYYGNIEPQNVKSKESKAYSREMKILSENEDILLEKLPEEDKKDVPGGDRVEGNSFHVSGEEPLYSVGTRIRCMIWNGDVVGYVKCELLQVSSRRLGKTIPEYAYYVRYLEDVWCADIKAGKTRWVWESKLRNTGSI